MSISMMARPGLIASDLVEIKGLKKLDGVYYIEQITHTVGERLQDGPGAAPGGTPAHQRHLRGQHRRRGG